MKRRVFIDMDGVLVDFDAYVRRSGLTPSEVKHHPGAYANMPPMSGAMSAIKSLQEVEGIELWIATKPPTGNAQAYADKVDWIYRYLPDFKRNIILTHHKGLLGNARDFLIDDRPHKAHCEEFQGQLIHHKNWSSTLSTLAWMLKATLDENSPDN